MVENTDVGNIDARERDYFLDLHHNDWGTGLGKMDQGWKVVRTRGSTDYVSRIITPKKGKSGETLFVRRQKGASPDRLNDLCETIIRFPSAPIYGIHRKQEYLVTLKRINYHEPLSVCPQQSRPAL